MTLLDDPTCIKRFTLLGEEKAFVRVQKMTSRRHFLLFRLVFFVSCLMTVAGFSTLLHHHRRRCAPSTSGTTINEYCNYVYPFSTTTRNNRIVVVCNFMNEKNRLDEGEIENNEEQQQETDDERIRLPRGVRKYIRRLKSIGKIQEAEQYHTMELVKARNKKKKKTNQMRNDHHAIGYGARYSRKKRQNRRFSAGRKN